MSCSVHDAVTLESRSVPVAVLCTTPFLNAAAAHARMLGRSDLRAVEVPHPLVSLDADGVHQRAETILSAVIERLLG